MDQIDLSNKHLLFVVSEDWYFLSHRLKLARALKGHGAKISVVCRVGKSGDQILQEGFNLINLDFQREGISPISAIRTVRKLAAIYRQEKPDMVIHVALFTVLLGSIAGFLSSARTMLNLITGLGFVFISESRKAKIIRFVVRTAFTLFAYSPRVKMIVQNQDDSQLFQHLGFQKERNLFVVIGSGVDTSVYYPAEKPPAHNQVTFVGRLLWAKGVGELVEAARLLKKRGRTYKIVLVGKPDPANPQSASPQDVDKWQNDQLVECLGHRSDIADIYRQSDIAILPSWREGLPKSLLEAAACGLPMITTDTPGCREIVRHNETGLIVPLHNGEKLADAIEDLMENPSLRAKFGKAAKDDIDQHYSDEKINAQMLRIIRNTLT